MPLLPTLCVCEKSNEDLHFEEAMFNQNGCPVNEILSRLIKLIT